MMSNQQLAEPGSRMEKLRKPVVVFILLISILQAVVFIWIRKPQSMKLMAFGLSLAGVVSSFVFIFKRRRNVIAILSVIYVLQLCLFTYWLSLKDFLAAPRLLILAIVLIHFVIILLAFLWLLKIEPVKSLLFSVSLILTIFSWEAYLQIMLPAFGVEWVGNIETHPVLETYYHPDSTLKTYFPGNRRGYFEVEPPEEAKWWLRVAGQNQAILKFSAPDTVKIEIAKAESRMPYDIQLNMPFLKVKSGGQYAVRLRARSEKSRRIFVGTARAHDPWNNLGLYDALDLSEQWQQFQQNFVATSDDLNARILFDVGADNGSVEISDVVLVVLPADRSIQPDLSKRKYMIHYETNDLGCRDRNYAIPKAAEKTRILLLGDSYTLGVGVRYKDTFDEKLETMLNSAVSPSERQFEVINCGVSGYGTKEERLFYELFGKQYHPDVVLLVMVYNDDLSFSEEVNRGYMNLNSSLLEYLFHPFADYMAIQRTPHREFQGCLQEVLRLNHQLQLDGSRLCLVIFRDNNDFSGKSVLGDTWNRLTKTMVSGVKQYRIPVLDLGPSLYKNHSVHELQVDRYADLHPNEIAHQIAAEEIQKMLINQHIIQ
jgi:hypothetical protein